MRHDYSHVVGLARKRSDTFVLVLTIIIILLAVWLASDGLFEVVLFGFGIVLVSLFVIRLMQIQFLGNALRVQNGRHAHLKSMVEEVAKNIKMPFVDVFITQDPYLNAFAVGYTHPYTIVLHSAIVEELSPAELRAILVHEMAHVKYRHTLITAYLYPIGTIVPLVGPVITWVFGFWSRRTELTADRLALAYTGDPHTLMMALIKVHVGAKFAEYLKEEGVLYQQKIGKGMMTKLSQSLGTHPFLVTRIQAIVRTSQKWGLAIPPETPRRFK